MSNSPIVWLVAESLPIGVELAEITPTFQVSLGIRSLGKANRNSASTSPGRTALL